jgi:hypothetical protein
LIQSLLCLFLPAGNNFDLWNPLCKDYAIRGDCGVFVSLRVLSDNDRESRCEMNLT